MRKTFECKVAVFAFWCACLASLGMLVGYFLYGPQEIHLLATRFAGLDFTLALRFDSLTTVMLSMVTLLAAVIGQYSLRYLDGETRQGYFFGWMLCTVSAVAMLVVSSNLILFFAAWLAVSWGLHKLLLYYPERKAAVYAARKKLLISRAGDIAIVVAIGLLYKIFGTFDFQKMFELANEASFLEAGGNTSLVSVAGTLLVLGAVTKSAQFPFHFWLPETMETPTPVSALMHAGIINAGGFLILRLSPIIQHATSASFLLAIVGSMTAVYASLVMITQNDIKKKLAYSTISQMGMMMFACGIGAYALALFHIIAHSFYKAYAFLSTGTLVEEAKKASLTVKPLNPGLLFVAVVLGLALMAGGIQISEGRYIAYTTYAAVLFLGLCQNFSSIRDRRVSLPRMITIVFSALILAGAIYSLADYGLGQYVASEIVRPKLSTGWLDPLAYICASSFAIFVTGMWLNNGLLSASNEAFRRLYILLWNGLYMGPVSSRFVKKLWPA